MPTPISNSVTQAVKTAEHPPPVTQSIDAIDTFEAHADSSLATNTSIAPAPHVFVDTEAQALIRSINVTLRVELERSKSDLESCQQRVDRDAARLQEFSSLIKQAQQGFEKLVVLKSLSPEPLPALLQQQIEQNQTELATIETTFNKLVENHKVLDGEQTMLTKRRAVLEEIINLLESDINNPNIIEQLKTRLQVINDEPLKMRIQEIVSRS